MVNHKFIKQHEVILKTKLGWNVIYIKLRIKHISPGFIVCSNNVRYAAWNGREIGTSTPDFAYNLLDMDEETGKTYYQLYIEQDFVKKQKEQSNE